MELKTILDSYQEIIKQKNAEFAQQFSTKITAFKQDLFIRLQKAAKGETQTFNEGDTHLLTGIKSLADLFNGKLPTVQKTIDLVIVQFDIWTKLMGLTAVLGNPSEKPIVVANLSLSEDSIKKIDNKLEDISKWLAKNEKKTDEKTSAIKAELAITRPNLEAVKTVLRKGIDLILQMNNLSKIASKLQQEESDLSKATDLLKTSSELNNQLQNVSLITAQKELSAVTKKLEIWWQTNKNSKFETVEDKQKFVNTVQAIYSQTAAIDAIQKSQYVSPAGKAKAIEYKAILENVQKEIIDIGDKQINLTFEELPNTKENEGIAGYCAFKTGKNGEPTIVIASKDNSLSIVAHELCHAAQFKRGEYGFNLVSGKPKVSSLLYDLYDEVEAYRVTMAVELNELNADAIELPKDITPEWVQAHGKASGSYTQLKKQNLSLDVSLAASGFIGYIQDEIFLGKATIKRVKQVNAETQSTSVKFYFNQIEILDLDLHRNMTMREYLSATINGVKIIDVFSPLLKVNL